MTIMTRLIANKVTGGALIFIAAAILSIGLSTDTFALEQNSFLASIKNETPVASTIPANGDLNPAGVAVAPVSIGKIRRGAILVSNNSNAGSLQGLGTTIVSIDPATHLATLFAIVPRHLDQCPGGVGMTTSIAVLRAGYVIVGSLPTNDGTTDTRGPGCLIVFDAEGHFVKTFADKNIDGPWSNMAVIDRGSSATLFVTNLWAISAKDQDKSANVLRIDLAIPGHGAPVIRGETIIASGFATQSDKDVLVIGPTGLALDRRGTLYVSDANANAIVAIPDAATRTTDAGTGREITKDGLLKRPLAMALAPNGDLLVLNGQDGRIVEIDPERREQVIARWINTNRMQTPPGNGNLFGLAMTLDGDGFYYVNADLNQLALSR